MLHHPAAEHRLLQPQLGGDLPGREAAAGDPINSLVLERLRENPALTTFYPTLLSSSERLAWVSTETREDQYAGVGWTF